MTENIGTNPGREYLRIGNVSKTYMAAPPEKAVLPTLERISLGVDEGEFVSIIGPSGCGKSTLFNIISGLEKPDSGSVILNGQEITGKRGFVSYMLQKDLLLPWRTVLDNCILDLELQGVGKASARKKAAALLEEFNLSEFASHYPGQLSGGMRQRVAFARTMLAGRKVLLLDEPFGALDAYTKSEMHNWLAEIWLKRRPTVLFITHDVEEALLLSDRVYVLTHRPARIKLVLRVGLPRPRTRELLVGDRFVELKSRLLAELFA